MPPPPPVGPEPVLPTPGLVFVFVVLVVFPKSPEALAVFCGVFKFPTAEVFVPVLHEPCVFPVKVSHSRYKRVFPEASTGIIASTKKTRISTMAAIPPWVGQFSIQVRPASVLWLRV